MPFDFHRYSSLDAFRRQPARRHGQNRARRAKSLRHAENRRLFRLEPLEPRLLLSVSAPHHEVDLFHRDSEAEFYHPLVMAPDAGGSVDHGGLHLEAPGSFSAVAAAAGTGGVFAWQDQDLSTPDVIDVFYDFRNQGGFTNFITSAQINMVELGLATWEQATQDNLKFTRNTTASTSGIINIGTGDLAALGFSSGSGGVLALGGGSFNSSNSSISAGVAWMDFAESWETVYANGNVSGTFDYFTVATHEIGHALGLNHSTVGGVNMMNATYPGELTTTSANDNQEVQLRYGGSAPPTPEGIIDNGDSGFSILSGTWGNTSNGFGADDRFNSAGTGSDVARWTFSDLTPGLYRVSVTWASFHNRATNAPFTVFDGGLSLGTVRLNQELSPDDFSADGADWEDLGTSFAITGDTLMVELSDDANEFVIADAVRVERMGDLPTSGEATVIDNGDSGFSILSGTWGSSGNGFGADDRFNFAGTGSDVARWTFTDLTPGTYRVSVTWASFHNRATNAPFTVFDGSSSLGTVRLNQELSPDDFSDAGAVWEDLGSSFAITGDTLVVKLSDDANEYVIADAVRIERVGDLPTAGGTVIDNGDSGFAIQSGTWGSSANGFGADDRFNFAGTGSDVARWTFSDLTPGTYRVSVTWASFHNRATNAPFTVFDGGSSLGTVRLNQELSPDDFSDAGAVWEDLGSSFAITGDTLVVKLSDDANEYVIADAVRIQRVGDLPTSSALVSDDGDSGFAIESGNWGQWSSGYEGDHRYNDAGTGTEVASWTFADLQPGLYRVWTTWEAHTNRATNAPFTIFDGAASRGTVRLNQKPGPDDLVDAGVAWEQVGTEFLITGNTLIVQLSDDANQFVVADGVRIQRIGGLPVSSGFQTAIASMNGQFDAGAIARDWDSTGESAEPHRDILATLMNPSPKRETLEARDIEEATTHFELPSSTVSKTTPMGMTNPSAIDQAQGEFSCCLFHDDLLEDLAVAMLE